MMVEVQDPTQPGFLQRLPAPPRKVALLRASRLGDFICAVPAFRALRAALPAAEITMITLPILHDLAVRLSYFDRVLAFPGYPGIAEQFFDARRTLRFFADVQAERLDLAVQMQESGVYSNPFTLMLGAQWTAGFVRDAAWTSRLDAALPIPHQGHESARILALTAFLGAPEQGRETEFPLRAEDHAAAEALLAGAQPPFIGLHPGAYDERRRWPPERLGAAGRILQHKIGGTVVVLGGEDDRERAVKVIAAADGGTGTQRRLNLAGRTGLALLGALISRLAVLIANDSGPAHIAYALGTPAAILYLPVHLERYGPPQAGPFHTVVASEGTEAGVRDIPVDQVVRAAKMAIAEGGRDGSGA